MLATTIRGQVLLAYNNDEGGAWCYLPSFNNFIFVIISLLYITHHVRAMIIEKSLLISTIASFIEGGFNYFRGGFWFKVIYLWAWITGSDIRKKNDPGTFPISFRAALDEGVDKGG